MMYVLNEAMHVFQLSVAVAEHLAKVGAFFGQYTYTSTKRATIVSPLLSLNPHYNFALADPCLSVTAALVNAGAPVSLTLAARHQIMVVVA
jgi:hypothetical protein